MQVPLSFLFGWFTDLGLKIVSAIPADNYPVRLAMVFTGIIILGFGISLAVIANVIMNSGEALVKAISDTLNRNFGNVKVIFDISCVTLSVILSLVLFDMKIIGTREGTVLSAFLTGFAVKFFIRLLKKPVDKILTEKVS